MHALTKPRFFIPVHGEYRHLHHHAMWLSPWA
jgi:mRNA degradation ribonuclease J1/J2